MQDYKVVFSGQDKLSPQVKKIKNEISNLSNTANKVGDIEQKFNKITNSTAPLQRRLRDLQNIMAKMRYDGLGNTDAYKKVSAEAQKMHNALKGAKDEINGISTKSMGLENIFGGINNKISSIVGSLGSSAGMAAAATMAATAAAKAAKAWADYNTELANHDQIVKVTIGLSGEVGRKMTDSLQAISKVYGVDFRDAVNAANTLISQFGVSSDEAIQLLRDGMQGMIEGDGPKLLSMIQQYAPAFRDAGISASQLIAIIHNSEGGIFTDQNMNAIVMGIKNIRLMTDQTSEALSKVGINGEEMARKLNDGSMTIFEALKEVSEAIENVDSNSQAAGEVMQSVFGRQGTAAGTNLGKAIATLNLNLEETKKQTGEVGEKVAELEKAHERLNTAIRDCFGYNGWSEMATGIKTELVEALTSVLNVTKEIKIAYEKTGKVGSTIFNSITNAALTSLGPLGHVLATLRLIKKEQGSDDGSNLSGGTTIAGALGKVVKTKNSPKKETPTYTPPKITTPKIAIPKIITPKVDKVEAKEGSLKYLDEQISKKRFEFSLAINNESRRTIQKEIDDLVSQRKTLEIQAKFDLNAVNSGGNNISDIVKNQFTSIDFDSIQKEASKKMGAVVDSINETEVEKWEEGEEKKKQIKALQRETLDSMISAAHSAADAFEMPEFDIMGTVAQAITNIALGYSQATVQAASLGPWAWIAFAAAGLAETIAAIASIKSATAGFATGGIVGGSSYSGDKLLARVNSGEMILPAKKASELGDVLSTNASENYLTIDWKLKGSDLYGSLHNFSKVKAKSGKITGIK